MKPRSPAPAQPDAPPRPEATPHWTLHEQHRARVERALDWAARTPAKESDLTSVLARCTHRPKG